MIRSAEIGTTVATYSVDGRLEVISAVVNTFLNIYTEYRF